MVRIWTLPITLWVLSRNKASFFSPSIKEWFEKKLICWFATSSSPQKWSESVVRRIDGPITASGSHSTGADIQDSKGGDSNRHFRIQIGICYFWPPLSPQIICLFGQGWTGYIFCYWSNKTCLLNYCFSSSFCFQFSLVTIRHVAYSTGIWYNHSN